MLRAGLDHSGLVAQIHRYRGEQVMHASVTRVRGAGAIALLQQIFTLFGLQHVEQADGLVKISSELRNQPFKMAGHSFYGWLVEQRGAVLDATANCASLG